jgi:hypothetical protein
MVHPPLPRGYAIDIRQAKQDAASTLGVAPAGVQHDPGAFTPGSLAPPSGQFSVQQEGAPSPRAPALLTSFSGIAFTRFIPPDPVVAAGPTNLVLATNGSVTVKGKTGAIVASTSLDAFFLSVRLAGEDTFDPRIVFDAGSNRFYLSAAGQIDDPSCAAGTCVSHLFLAVSKSSSPATTGSGDWYFYAFDATLDGATPTANWADFPGLGVDNGVVVLTANMFSFSQSQFETAKIRILDKAVLITGGAVTWIDFVGMRDPSTGSLSSSLQPALTFGSPATFFLVSAASALPSCDLVVWGIANPLSFPTLSPLTATAGGTCDVPPNAPQLGGGTPLDTADSRLLNAVYRTGSLWTAQAIGVNFGSGNVSAIRWVQIDVSSWPSTVGLTQDSTFGANGIWYFYPAVMVDGLNNLAVVFARSSPSEFGSASYTGRLGTDPPNTLQPSALLKAGTANYQLLDSTGDNRWGDYYGIALDPSDGSFWALGEYATTSRAWGTWVGHFGFSPGTSPTLINLSTLGLVQTGDNVMIGGFIIAGDSPKTLLVRAVGPSLAAFGVPGVLSNPVVVLFSGQTAIAENDDWQVSLPLCQQTGHTCGTPADIAATGLAPSQLAESALLITLAPGPYTAIVSGVGGTTGVGLIEVFEVDSASRLTNISARGRVETGDNVMIGGFIIAGDSPKTLLVRAVGPSLADFGVPGVLSNPVVVLFSGQTPIARNDDWQVADPLCQQTGHTCGTPADIAATGLAPSQLAESALLITLAPGPYTAIVRGIGGTTGVGLVEVFEVP